MASLDFSKLLLKVFKHSSPPTFWVSKIPGIERSAEGRGYFFCVSTSQMFRKERDHNAARREICQNRDHLPWGGQTAPRHNSGSPEALLCIKLAGISASKSHCPPSPSCISGCLLSGSVRSSPWRWPMGRSFGQGQISKPSPPSPLRQGPTPRISGGTSYASSSVAGPEKNVS